MHGGSTRQKEPENEHRYRRDRTSDGDVDSILSGMLPVPFRPRLFQLNPEPGVGYAEISRGVGHNLAA